MLLVNRLNQIMDDLRILNLQYILRAMLEFLAFIVDSIRCMSIVIYLLMRLHYFEYTKLED